MGELLALTSALCFGATHFISGLLSRRHHGVTVAAWAQAGGTVVSLVPALVTRGAAAPPSGALVWGALSGLGTGVGVACLYWSMARGPMSVVVPVSDVTAVGVPVLAGLALLGDRPSLPALTGIALGLPALWLVSRGGGSDGASGGRGAGPPALLAALVAGLGIALHFVALARIPAAAGWWPVVLSRALSVAVVLALLPVARAPLALPARPAAGALAAGALGTAATVLYLLATRQELLSVAVVLSALYPAVPVLLALTLLRERLTGAQTVGLLGAVAAVALIALN